MLRINVRAAVSDVAALLMLLAWSSAPARAETLIRTAAISSGVFPVPSSTSRDASPVRTAAGACACHEGCLRTLEACKSKHGQNCYREEQTCWTACRRSHSDCRND